MQRKLSCLTVVIMTVMLAPALVRAEVSVTEIAWMGTGVSANDEWIELHNDGSASVSLSGWTLNAADGTPAITLSGSVPAGAYVLLERTDDTSFPGIAALLVFTGALGNEGESLTLKNGGTTVQSLSFAGGWPAGDSTTKETMQLNGSSWVTATETAGSATTASGNEGDDDDDDTGADDDISDDDDDTGEEADNDDNTVQTVSSGASTKAPERKMYDTMLLKIEHPKMAIAGSPTLFKMEALNYDRSVLRKGKFFWNMGDGVLRSYTRGVNYDGEGFYHTYEHPGTYHVTVKYHKTFFEDIPPDLSDDFIIEVFEPTITITKVHPDGGIEIKNSSSREIDLSLWQIKDSGGETFEIPKDTKLLAGKSFTFSKKATRLNAFSGLSIFTPSDVLVTTFSSKPVSTKVGTSVASNSLSKEKTTQPLLGEGQVLGIQTAEAASEGTPEKDKSQNGLVFVLAFIVLVLIAVIAVLLLKREDKKEEEEEGYELLDE